jgi:hypothetical protein
MAHIYDLDHCSSRGAGRGESLVESVASKYIEHLQMHASASPVQHVIFLGSDPSDPSTRHVG